MENHYTPAYCCGFPEHWEPWFDIQNCLMQISQGLNSVALCMQSSCLSGAYSLGSVLRGTALELQRKRGLSRRSHSGM